jgi:hypothetical protein
MVTTARKAAGNQLMTAKLYISKANDEITWNTEMISVTIKRYSGYDHKEGHKALQGQGKDVS